MRKDLDRPSSSSSSSSSSSFSSSSSSRMSCGRSSAAQGILFDHQFRVIVVGDSAVGKSSLLRYFADARVELDSTEEPTIGADFFCRQLEINPGNVRVKLQLWDTAGQERFRSITKSYYRNSVGVLLVYDITKRSSFENLRDWFDDVCSHVDPKTSVFTVIGHKADKGAEQRVVASNEAQHFAEANGFRFFETSAANGQNIETAFVALAQDIYDLRIAGNISMDEEFNGICALEGVEKETSSTEEKKKCC